VSNIKSNSLSGIKEEKVEAGFIIEVVEGSNFTSRVFLALAS